MNQIPATVQNVSNLNKMTYSAKFSNRQSCWMCKSKRSSIRCTGSLFVRGETGSKLYWQLECSNCNTPKLVEHDLFRQPYRNIFWE